MWCGFRISNVGLIERAVSAHFIQPVVNCGEIANTTKRVQLGDCPVAMALVSSRSI